MTRKLRHITAGAFMAVLLAASLGWGAMGDIENLAFQGFAGDVLGPGESAAPDGRPDATFSLSLRGVGAVSGFSLKSENGKSAWDTVAGNGVAGILVKDSGGNVIAGSDGGMSHTPLLLGMGITLTVHDDDSIARGGKFTVTARFIDDSEAHATIAVPPTKLQRSSGAVRILSAKWADAKTRDLTGRGERLRGDGTPDESVRVMTQGAGTLTGVTVQGVEGERAAWDTVPGNNSPLVAVTKDGVTLNRPDGSVSAPLRDRTVLELWLTAAGVIEKGESKLEVRLFFSDGSVASRVIEKGAPQTPADREEFVGSAVLTGPSDRDLVGKSERPTGNGTKDWKIDLKVGNRGTITAVMVDAVAGPAGAWDTIAGNGRRLVGVTDRNGDLLNRDDGTVTIPVQRPTELRLWMEDYDVLADEGTRARVTLTYDDGRTLSREVVRRIEAPEPTPSAAKPTPAAGGREILFSNPRRASSSDYVGTSEKLGKNKKADWLFDCEIRGEGRVEAIVAEAVGTPGVWDTIPGNGNWALGVVAPGKGLLNRRDGSVSFYASQYPKIQLFFEDDGTMRQGASHFKITVIWSDGTKTSAES